MISSAPTSADSHSLVSLQTEPPLRMAKTVVDCERRVVGERGAIHRLQREALEAQSGEVLRPRVRLRIDKLQFIAGSDPQLCSPFWRHADPVEAGGRLERPIGFDGDEEAAFVQS